MARNESSPGQIGAPVRRRTTLIWWSLAAGSLLAGYADLVRGGETIAPILLVLGYCVLVPLAILRS
jgi:peptidoglycan/LPS O-acetylase OafA/YrhL